MITLTQPQTPGTIVLDILAFVWLFSCIASYVWYHQARNNFLQLLQIHARIRIPTLGDPTGQAPITFSSRFPRGETRRNRPLFAKQWPYVEVEQARHRQQQRWWFFLIVWLGGVLALCAVGLNVG